MRRSTDRRHGARERPAPFAGTEPFLQRTEGQRTSGTAAPPIGEGGVQHAGWLRNSPPAPSASRFVFTLRCTQKLLAKLNAVPDPTPAAPDSVLGDWYANLFSVGRTQVVLAVSQRTLLPVVVSAKQGSSLAHRFTEALEGILSAIEVPMDEVITERAAMQHRAVGKTASRRIVGSLNGLAFQLEVGMAHFPDRTLQEQSLWIAKTPLKVVVYSSPDRTTITAFAARRALRAAGAR